MGDASSSLPTPDSARPGRADRRKARPKAAAARAGVATGQHPPTLPATPPPLPTKLFQVFGGIGTNLAQDPNEATKMLGAGLKQLLESGELRFLSDICYRRHLITHPGDPTYP